MPRVKPPILYIHGFRGSPVGNLETVAMFAQPINPYTHVREQVDEVVHIENIGYVVDDDFVGCEQSGANHLQRLVLCSLRCDFTV